MNASVTIVSVGPGNPELLNLKTVRILQNAECIILRTEKNDIAAWLHTQNLDYSSMDRFYDSADDFDKLYQSIASEIWKKASDSKVVYAVPDPFSDLSVKELFSQKPSDSSIEIIPGISSFDINMAALKPYNPQSDLRFTSAYDLLLNDYNPNIPLLIVEIDNPILAGQIKIYLSDHLEDSHQIIYFSGRHAPSPISLFELDRLRHYDHLSAVLIPASDYLHRESFSLQDLCAIMEQLRAPEGCPWDRKQTHHTLRPYLIEEAWECAASIRDNDMPHLAEELGDLLFQIVFHSSIAKTFDEFTLNDVISAICQKMIRRHPHVFLTGNQSAFSTYSGESWEKIKQEESGSASLIDSLDDVTPYLPSLKYAAKVIKKLNQIGCLHHSPLQVVSNIEQKLSEIRYSSPDEVRKTVGLLLFLFSELCCSCEADGELLLHDTVDHVKESLRTAEKKINQDGKAIESLTFEELGVYLKHVKGEIE